MLLLYILYQPLYCDPATYRAKIHMVKDKTNYTAPTFKIVSLMRYQEHMHHALIPDICLFCTLPHF